MANILENGRHLGNLIDVHALRDTKKRFIVERDHLAELKETKSANEYSAKHVLYENRPPFWKSRWRPSQGFFNVPLTLKIVYINPSSVVPSFMLLSQSAQFFHIFAQLQDLSSRISMVWMLSAHVISSVISSMFGVLEL